MMKFNVFLVLIASMLMGCTSSKKVIAPTAKSEALEALIEKGTFSIESDWAYPLTTASFNAIANSGLLAPGSNPGSISLVGNTNYVKIYGDSISMHLPFYGERRLPGQYGTNQGGIICECKAENYVVTKNEKKQQHTIKFRAISKNESYQVILTLFPNWESSIVVNSSHRTSMRYRGTVSAIETKETVVVN